MLIDETYAPFIYGIIIITTILYPIIPKILWGARNDKNIKVLFYNLTRESENPYMDEPTSISIYDPDTQVLFSVEDVYDDDSYEELVNILNDLSKQYTKVFFVTYDVENKDVCFKLILQDVLEDMPFKTYCIDLKRLFYAQHPYVAKITYKDILEYYRVPRLECKPIEYSAVFEQLILDYDINIRKDITRLDSIYKILNPLSAK
jgi:hypothetical protein